jgi:glycosyltransferase involved in cell wall biosynthesis
LSKKKILLLSDHALSTSGVGCQSRFLIDGLVKTGKWSFRQFGAAVKHSDYRTIKVNDDFIIKPIDGFGNPVLLRNALASERPDVLMLFTDPRFFHWVWEMEDEIHQICPIAYWHVWDNLPVPKFNHVLYESTDLINCHSHLTYSFVKDMFPDRTNFVPHTLPPNLFYPLPENEISKHKASIVSPKKLDHFVALWINRNAKRKRPNDVLWAWKIFMDNLRAKHSTDKALLIMHTQPDDQEGPNLFATAEMLGIEDSIVFSPDRIDFEKMNVVHNVADCVLNISFAEGFGLSTLEAMQAGTPIIAAKTGGLTRQVVDHRDGSENGVALDIDLKTLVGSQSVPYIFEDYVSAENIANGLMKIFEMSPQDRAALGQKARAYVESEFSYDKMINKWDETLTELTENWKTRYTSWSFKEI